MLLASVPAVLELLAYQKAKLDGVFLGRHQAARVWGLATFTIQF